MGYLCLGLGGSLSGLGLGCLGGWLSGSGGLSRWLGLGRCPEGQVVTEKLHDEGRVLVALLRESVELSNGIIECLLGKLASLVGRVEDLVIEDGEVQGKTKTDGVGGGKVGSSNVSCGLVGLERLISGSLALVANGELSEVTVVVALPTIALSSVKKIC